MQNVLIVKNRPVNGILYTKIFPHSKELEEQLRKSREYEIVKHNPDFDLEEYKHSPVFA